MKTIAVLVLGSLVTSAPAFAQSVADGSDSEIPAEAAAALLGGAIYEFREPDRTVFRELRFVARKGELNIRNEILTSDVVEGLVNTPNMYGGMTGYSPFLFYIEDNRFQVRRPATAASP